nr:hypothetical protein [Nitrosomonas nitrosa]
MSVRRTAFPLIELLTVMAIITLPIGILTSALGAARDRAKQTGVKAQINAMSVGLEAFNADQSIYPPSNAGQYTTDPYNTAGTRAAQLADWGFASGANVLQGANLLVDALVGRDFLGYDPNPSVAGTTYIRWNSNNDRRQPFYSSGDGVSTSSANNPPSDFGGTIPNTHGEDLLRLSLPAAPCGD